ncbi:Hsp20/alpha crystallin family protein [Acidobacteriota bacterium]
MSLLRFRPYSDLWDMYGKINRLFEEDLKREGEETPMSDRCWAPAADIYETKEEYVFKLELPGISKDDIKVELEGDKLRISGDRKEEKDVEKENYHRVERVCGSFARSFQLPKNANGEKVNANMKDGILELRIPKQEEAKAKSIPINIK